MLSYYKPSGKLGKNLILAFIIPGILLSSILGMLYQMLLDFIPIVYFDACVALGAAIVLAAIAIVILRIARCRNPAVGCALGSALAFSFLVASYFQAAHKVRTDVTLELNKRQEIADLSSEARSAMAQNISLLDALAMRAATGWKISKGGNSASFPIQGALVYGIWFIEAIVVIGFGAVAGGGVARTTYCERCDLWIDTELLLREKVVVDSEVLTKIQYASCVDELVAPMPQSLSDHIPYAPRVVLEAKVCEKCRQSAYLNVKYEQCKADKKGDMREHSTTLHHGVVLERRQLERLLEEADRRIDASA